MDDSDDDENAIVRLTSLGVVGVGLAALFLGYDWFWITFVVGFAVLVPAVKILTDELGLGSASGGGSTQEDSAEEWGSTRQNSSRTQARADASESKRDSPESKQDSLDTLRDRYARGELSEAEFEQKVERLLETETLEDAREYVGRDAADPTRDAADSNRETNERAK